MNDRSDEFVTPQFKAVMLNVLIKQCNMPGGGEKNPDGIMFKRICASILSEKHNLQRHCNVES